MTVSPKQSHFVLAILLLTRPTMAQVAPDSTSAAVAADRGATSSPDRSDTRRKLDSQQSDATELTYQSPSADNESSSGGSSRVLRYRIEPKSIGEAESDGTILPSRYGSAIRATDAGMFTPYTLSPRINAGQSWVRTVAGYDTAAGSARARSVVESAVTSFFAVRADYEHGPATGYQDRVGIGGRFQVLNQQSHGIDLGLGTFYRPRDFRGEGNVVGALMLGRSFGRLRLFGSALFGSDAEGDDQDIDTSLSATYRVSDRIHIGWDNHFNYVTSTDVKRFATVTTDWELQLEPTVVVSLGPLAILTEAGFSALQTTGPIGETDSRRIVHTGMIAMAGAGGAF